MGALTIAFDTTIVGALALPWVYLVVHLFFSDGENRIKPALDWVNKHQAQVPAGILLFAMTYTLGSAMTRIAQDFFNDDDIHIPVGRREDGHLLRWPVTEDRIRAHVYCDDDRQDLLPTERGSSALGREIEAFHKQECVCGLTLRAWVCRNGKKGFDCSEPGKTDSDPYGYDEACREAHQPDNADSRNRKGKHPDDDLVKIATDIFGLQENTLMDKGGDYSAHLRQLHDQIMVLRGASFNGLIAFSLCLFAWGVVLSDKPGSDHKRHPRMRWVFMLMPAIYLFAGIVASYHHLVDEKFLPPDPPYMEFTLLLLGGGGLWVLWPPSPKSLRHTQDAGANAAGEAGKEEDTFATPHWRIERWGRLVALSLVLTLAAFLGWWSTEVIYRDQVVYSYDSQFADTQGATQSQK
jgi:hypothetical protein